MGRILALSGLLLFGTMLLAQPVPPLPQPPPLLPISVTLPRDPALPTQPQLLHPDHSSSVLPPRLGVAPPIISPEIAAHQRELDRLRTEREALAVEREKAGSDVGNTNLEDAKELARLRAQLADVIAKLEAKKAKEAGRPTNPGTPPLHPAAPIKQEVMRAPTPAIPQPTDPLQLAELQFRDRQYDAALQTLRHCVSEKLNKEERVLVLYLSAGCWRHLGKLDEAVALYRDVASSRDDDALAECATWHLHAIETRRGILNELAEIRARRQAQGNERWESPGTAVPGL